MGEELLGYAEGDTCHDGDESMFFDCEASGIQFPLKTKGVECSIWHDGTPEITNWICDEHCNESGYANRWISHGE
jgi:hypothetical protein